MSETPKNIHEVMVQAAAYHRARRFPEAERLYRAILQVSPDYPAANHNLGAMATHLGKPDLGLPYLKAALTADPGEALYWLSYAEGLLAAGRDHEVQELVEQARTSGLAIDVAGSIEPRLRQRDDTLKAAAADIHSLLPLYAPSSAGDARAVAGLTMQGAGQIFPLLAQLAKRKLSPGNAGSFNAEAEDVTNLAAEESAAEKIKPLFDLHGSDKARAHNYHHMYGHILRHPEAATAVLEIGLGTNNVDVVSNMGQSGRPGASLRAFRDFLPNARIYGADIDRRILFQEERIETFFVDQTDPASFTALGNSIGDRLFDLIIDDGLHSPAANVTTMLFALDRLKIGGWFVVEDIAPQSASVWEVVPALLPAGYRARLFRCQLAYLFAIQRSA
ncbi:MAG: hypothetical protein ACLGJC_24035 [Alphaproteobacteria bacterium]